MTKKINEDNLHKTLEGFEKRDCKIVTFSYWYYGSDPNFRTMSVKKSESIIIKE